MNIKPSLADLSEGILNNLFKSADPPLLASVELNLCDAGGLDLFKFFDTESLPLDGDVEDAVVLKKLVALSSDFNHRLNNLLFDEEGVKAEVGELLREIVLRNRHHTVIRHILGRRLWRKAQVGLNHVLQLVGRLLHGLVDYNPVHGAAIVKVDFL